MQGPHHLDVVLFDILEKQREIDIIVVQIVQMNDVGGDSFHLV